MSGVRWTEEQLADYRRQRVGGEAKPVEAKPSKYGNRRVEVDGQRFDSQAEADFYVLLKQSQQRGEIRYFLRQVPFHLPGGVIYRCDFLVVNDRGEVHHIDVKGYATKEFRRAKRQVEALYPVTIEVVRRLRGGGWQVEEG